MLREQIVELQKRGLSYNQIQVELGCSKGTIAYHLGLGQKKKTTARRKAGRNRVRQFIQEYKTGKKCKDCGEDYPYWILEFDHLKDKKFNLARAGKSTTSIAIVKREIQKCDLVCANCHRNRTFQRLTKYDWSHYEREKGTE